jgi:omega-amidase
MVDNLQVHLIQTSLVWENPRQNRVRLQELITRHIKHTDLIVLPEMFSTGFSMNTATCAETYQSASLSWMQDVAAHFDAMVTGSLMFRDNDNSICNRFFWMSPQGVQGYYDKRHLFKMAGEHKHFKQGIRQEIFTWRGWNIMPQICYDLRFPVFSRNTGQIDLYLYVANWPSVRRDAWKHLLLARAIENQAYVAGVNIVGRDGNGIDYSGDTLAADPLGNTLCAVSNRETVVSFEADMEMLKTTRKKLPFLNDRDDFSISM